MIGILDSGIGGLSIYKEIKKLLPTKKVIYLADQKNFPYGEKDENQLLEIVGKNIRILIEMGANVVVIGCNTATVSLIDKLRVTFPLPIIGIEPAVKVAANNSRNNKIGLIATKMTVSKHDNDSYINPSQELFKVNCGDLVKKIEDDYSSISDEYLKRIISPLVVSGVDSIALGCTHYHFIIDKLERLYPDITFYAPGEAIANRVLSVLDNKNLILQDGEDIFLTTGKVDRFRKTIKMVVDEGKKDVREI